MGSYMASSPTNRDTTTIEVKRNVHQQLEELKPFNSMSFNELIVHLIDSYEPDRQGDKTETNRQLSDMEIGREGD